MQLSQGMSLMLIGPCIHGGGGQGRFEGTVGELG